MGYRIKEKREEKGMTQIQLSEQSGVSRVTIIALESGNDYTTTTKTLSKIASALGVSVDELFLSDDCLVN